MLFEGGKEAGKRDADSVETRNEFFAAENPFRISPVLLRGGCGWTFPDQLDGRAHLCCSTGVAHHARDFPKERFGFSSRRGRENLRQQCRQDQGPRNPEPEPSMLHDVLPPRRRIRGRSRFRRRLDCEIRSP